MMRLEVETRYKHLARAATRLIRASLPSPAALRRAAVKHLARRGNVRYPMKPRRPKLSRRRKADPRHPAEIALNVRYQVPVRIETPWGPVIQAVMLARSYDGKSWTCSSSIVNRRSLEARARAARYHFLVFTVPDAPKARALARRAAEVSGVLDRRSFDIAEWNRFVPDFEDSPLFWSTGREGRTTAEFRRFVRLRRSRRLLVSRRAIALTAKQQRALARLWPKVIG